MPTQPGRVLFVDLARAVAVLFMIQGHTLAVLLVPGFEEGAVFKFWLYLRGLTSCAFLLLSGYSFSLATDRHWADYESWTPRLRRRVVRFGFFLLLGYAMRIPVRPLSDIPRITPAQWQAFAAVDILQLVAVTLLALQALMWVVRTRERLATALAGLAAAIILLTPLVWAFDWTRVMPVFLRAYLLPTGGSLFPLFPWAAYLLFGAALGLWFVGWRQRGAPGSLAVRYLVTGTVMIVAGVVFHNSPFAPYGAIDFWATSPNLFLVKAGSVLVLLGGAIRATRSLTRLPSIATALSRESLIVYFVHVCVLYGSIWNPGLAQIFGPRLGPAATAGWVVIMLAAMTLMAWVWNAAKQRSKRAASLFRLAVWGAMLYLVL